MPAIRRPGGDAGALLRARHQQTAVRRAGQNHRDSAVVGQSARHLAGELSLRLPYNQISDLAAIASPSAEAHAGRLNYNAGNRPVVSHSRSGAVTGGSQVRSSLRMNRSVSANRKLSMPALCADAGAIAS